MHLETREIICTKSTKNPNSQWVTEQAKEFAEQTKTREHRSTHLVHDRDTKFSAEFKAALKEECIECKKLPVRSPNLNATVERVIQSIKHEVLNHFIALGRDHLDYLVKTFTAHYDTNRPKAIETTGLRVIKQKSPSGRPSSLRTLNVASSSAA